MLLLQEPPTNIQIDALSLVIGIVSGIATSVLGTLIIDYIKSRPPIRVKVIRNAKDRDVEGFCDLYKSVIDEAEQIDTAEILRWIDEDRVLRKLTNHTYYHYLIVGKISGKVISFLKVMYSKDAKYLFIAYYGIDTTVERARLFAGREMIAYLGKLIADEMPDCKALLFEVASPDQTDDKEEARRRAAKIRLFKDTVRRQYRNVYEIKMKYTQPFMDVNPLDGTIATTEETLALLYVPVADSPPSGQHLPKEKVMDILRFIYLRIYRPTFRYEPEKDVIYQAYLSTLLKRYSEELPETIPVV